MEFREYATHETSAVVARLMASQADAQIRLAREALEAAARALEAKTADVGSADDVRDLVQRLEAAAGIAVQRVQQDAQKALDALREELDGARRQAADGEAQVAALRGEVASLADRATTAECDLDATIEAHRQIELELGGFRTQLDAARAEVSRLEMALGAAATERTALIDDLAAARARISQLEASLAAAEAATAEEADARATLHGELDAARTRLTALEESRTALRAELEASQAAWTALDADLEAARAGAAALDAELGSARALLGTRDTELDVTRTTLGAVEADLDAARASAHAAQSELETTRAALATALGDLDTMRTAARHTESSLDSTRAALSSAVADLEASRASTASVEASLETTRQALATAEAELSAARAERDEARQGTPLVESAAAACHSLSAAATTSELFGALVARMSAHFTRVAIFRARAHHLEGEHGHGFDASTDVSKLVLPLTLESIITRAHASRATARLEPGRAGGSPPFGGSPHLAMALPIAYQDEPVAVLYADADEPVAGGHDERPAFAEVLAAHAAVLLTRMAQEMKTLHELRDYAAMLLQEAQQMYAADEEAGRSEADRRRRLKDSLECARQLFTQRAALEGAAAAGLLDEQIAAAVEGAASSPFARDLGQLAGTKQKAQRTAS